MQSMIKIGFTGTRVGMTERQKIALRHQLTILIADNRLLADNPIISEFHHGDCIGSDTETATIASSLGYKVVAHPGCDRFRNTPTRANCPYNSVVLETLPYKQRDQDIVNCAEVLIAAPKQPQEQWRGSGTWMTIRMGRRKGIHVVVMEP